MATTAQARSRSAALLADLLSAPDFGVAKSQVVGLEAALGDYVAAQAVLTETSARQQSALATGLAEVMARLVDHGLPYLADTLHAVVGYRLDAADLHEQALRLLSDPAFLERFVQDEAKRASALIAFSHGQATRLRRTGDPANLREARRLLLRAVSTADEAGQQISAKQRSSVFYDLGYLDFLYGDHQRALNSIRRSVEFAEAAGDRVGAWISRLVEQRVGLLSGAVSPAVFQTTHQEALAFLTSDQAHGPHVARWVLSARLHLVDLALFTGNAELASDGLRVLEQDRWLQQASRVDIALKYRARVATVRGEWQRACALFATLLRDELTDPPPHREELARDLYYYGRALAGSGDIAAARRVWDLGLRCPDDAANWPWQPRISDELRQLAD